MVELRVEESWDGIDHSLRELGSLGCWLESTEDAIVLFVAFLQDGVKRGELGRIIASLAL